MRKSQFTPEQMLQALRQAESGTTVVDICRTLGVTATTFDRWKKQSTGLDVSEWRELKPLREEHRRLTGVVADLTLDQAMRRDALGTRWCAPRTDVPPCAGRRSRSRSANGARAVAW